MNIKGIVFLCLSSVALVLSIYVQINIINNDIKEYEQHSGANSANFEKVIPIEAMKDTDIYVTYDSTIKDGSRYLKIMDEKGKELISEIKKEIHLYKKKVRLNKGNYRIITELNNAKSIKESINIIYRNTEVIIQN
ncbi:MAG: hypothetical protein N4A63_16565 [Vallitalea sp.]|jgi:type III secretory pathway component EscR|nr:hypothetical protein [Vallitalea sp.]